MKRNPARGLKPLAVPSVLTLQWALGGIGPKPEPQRGVTMKRHPARGLQPLIVPSGSSRGGPSEGLANQYNGDLNEA